MTPEKKREIADALLRDFKWYAVDENGVEYVFASEPEMEDAVWVTTKEDYVRVGCIDMTDVDWRETKERVDE